jgi:hypothetical protein
VSSLIAFYSFDSVTTDATGTYPASGIVSPTYVTGWVGSAISFNYSNAQRLSTTHIPLASATFTIDFWFYSTDLTTYWEYSLMGEFTSQAADHVLFLNIRNHTPYFGFWADDTISTTNVSVNTWYHIAFVYNNTTRQRTIYLNGLSIAQSIGTGYLQTTSSNFTIGGATIGGASSLYVYYTGYIDHLTISGRVKSACEIYLDAALACYFPFDLPSPLVDSGPNFLTAVNLGATSVVGRLNQAFQFSSSPSYITVSGITALQPQYTVFTISMWINPTSVIGGGTLIHGSTVSNGRYFFVVVKSPD